MPKTRYKCNFETENLEAYHTKGEKDQFMIRIVPKNDSWDPKNYELFKLLFMWFRSEDYKYPDGYGALMPWFYASLCFIDNNPEGRLQTALEATEYENDEAADFFEEVVQEHADDLIAELEELKGETADG